MNLIFRTLSVFIERPPREVYEFASNPENMPHWVTTFCRSIQRSEDAWRMDTPYGPMKIRFAEKNTLGVLDHYVTMPSGVEFHVPMRVVPNGTGSEVIFTLFRTPDLTDDLFAEDLRLVERDLNTLKRVLESSSS